VYLPACDGRVDRSLDVQLVGRRSNVGSSDRGTDLRTASDTADSLGVARSGWAVTVRTVPSGFVANLKIVPGHAVHKAASTMQLARERMWAIDDASTEVPWMAAVPYQEVRSPTLWISEISISSGWPLAARSTALLSSANRRCQKMSYFELMVSDGPGGRDGLHPSEVGPPDHVK
jgi:hypothetical protein